LLALAPVGLSVLGLFTLESPALHLSGAMLVLAPPAVSFPITGLYLRPTFPWQRFGSGLLAASPVTLVPFVYILSFWASTRCVGVRNSNDCQ
jgi:hypothetical protein